MDRGSWYWRVLAAKYSNIILRSYDSFVGKPAIRIPTDDIKKFKGIQITWTAIDRSQEPANSISTVELHETLNLSGARN